MSGVRVGLGASVSVSLRGWYIRGTLMDGPQFLQFGLVLGSDMGKV